MNKPVVSVIITCHNYSDLVGNAIKSVLAQDYPHDKLIIAICDDGSDDDSEGVIKSYISKQQNINGIIHGHIQDVRAVFIQNAVAKKQAYARNQLIRATWNIADAFCVLDADDEYLEGKITKSVNKWLEDPDVIGFIYSDLLIHNLSTGVKIHEIRQSFDRSELMRQCITSNSPLISKKALSSCGVYDISVCPSEDYLLSLSVTTKFIAIHIPEPLSEYHVTGRNSTITTSKEDILETHRKLRLKLAGQLPYKYE